MRCSNTARLLAFALSTTSVLAFAGAAFAQAGDPQQNPPPSTSPIPAPPSVANRSTANGSGSEGVQLQEVIVTATRRAENLQNVPVAVTAVTAADLKNEGVFNTTDMNHSLPNLQVSSPYGEQQPNFSIRGVGVGTEFNANAASPVGVYVDEVYQAFRSSHGQQLYDLNQIEVVRGPQGTLYGRNTTGGAINFITNQPKLSDANGYLTVGYGNYNRFTVEGAGEITSPDGKFGLRVAGTYLDEDNYVKNILPAGLNRSIAGGASGLNLDTGRQPGGYEKYAFRATARYKPTDRIDLTLKVYDGDLQGGTESPISVGSSTANPSVVNFTNPNFLLGGLFSALAPTGLVPASYSRAGLNSLTVQDDTIGKAYSTARGAVFTAKIKLTEDLQFISITDYDSGEYKQANTDCDGTPVRLCAIGYLSHFHAFNEDARFNYNHGPLNVIAGFYYGQDSITTDNVPDFFNFLSDVTAAVGLPPSYFNPGGAFNGTALSAASLPTGITATQHFKQERTSYAGYGEATYKITPTISFTGGIRYTSDDDLFKDGLTTYYDNTNTARLLTVSSFQQNGAFAPYFLQAVKNEAGQVVVPSYQSLGIPVPAGLRRDGKSSQLTGRAILDWKPTESSLVYASYSHGYRAGTFNGLAYGSANQVYFVPPEDVDAFEGGFKSRFLDNRLQINGAVFYYKYSGQQGQVVDATATANLVSLSGKLYGLELESEFAVNSKLTVSASVGAIHSAYDSGACPGGPLTGFPAQVGSCVSSSGGPVSVGGNPFPYAADSSANIGFDWRPFEIAGGKILIHADTQYTGQFYYDSFKDYSRPPLTNVTTGVFKNGDGDYWLVNSRISYTRDRYTISAWVKNLTDKTYYPFGIALENLFGVGYKVRGEPRTFGAEVTARF